MQRLLKCKPLIFCPESFTRFQAYRDLRVLLDGFIRKSCASLEGAPATVKILLRGSKSLSDILEQVAQSTKDPLQGLSVIPPAGLEQNTITSNSEDISEILQAHLHEEDASPLKFSPETPPAPRPEGLGSSYNLSPKNSLAPRSEDRFSFTEDLKHAPDWSPVELMVKTAVEDFKSKGSNLGLSLLRGILRAEAECESPWLPIEEDQDRKTRNK